MIQKEDVSISYLPLAHMFERMIQVADVVLMPLTFVRTQSESPRVATGHHVLPRGQSGLLPG